MKAFERSVKTGKLSLSDAGNGAKKTQDAIAAMAGRLHNGKIDEKTVTDAVEGMAVYVVKTLGYFRQVSKDDLLKIISDALDDTYTGKRIGGSADTSVAAQLTAIAFASASKGLLSI